MSSRPTPFLEKLDSATSKTECGLYMFEGFLPPVEAQDAFDVLGDDEKFPWNTKPLLYGELMTQHAYEHNRYKNKKSKKKKISNSEGLSKLEAICSQLEQEFDVKISDVFCNRFQDPKHRVDWHKDTYGRHICVLTLGSKRRIEFRNNKTKQVEEMTPSTGDLYLMPLNLNNTHKHRVCSAEESTTLSEQNHSTGTRLSFVFFFEVPSYAKEFKISTKDKIDGFIEELIEDILSETLMMLLFD